MKKYSFYLDRNDGTINMDPDKTDHSVQGLLCYKQPSFLEKWTFKFKYGVMHYRNLGRVFRCLHLL